MRAEEGTWGNINIQRKSKKEILELLWNYERIPAEECHGKSKNCKLEFLYPTEKVRIVNRNFYVNKWRRIGEGAVVVERTVKE